MNKKPLSNGIALALILVGGHMATHAQADVLPPADLPDAKPGECYARVLIPAEYRQEVEEVVVREASHRVEIIPARYQWTEEKVRVKDASYKLLPVPAEYGTVTERVEVSSARRMWTSGKSNREASSALLQAAMQMGVSEDVPAGTCFNEYLEPARYRNVTEKVLKKEASEKLLTVPAKYEWVDEKVLVKEASTKVVEVPATYETVVEEVLVEPARQIWKKGRGPKERIDDSTGEILCLVEVPAKYKKVSKRILKTPAATRQIAVPAVYKTQKIRRLIAEPEVQRIDIPAEYSTISRREKVADDTYYWFRAGDKSIKGERTGNQLCLREFPAEYNTVTRTVVKNPASTKRIEVPAVFNTVKVRKLVAPAEEKRIEIPAKTRKIARKAQVSDERLEWRRILCDTNINPDLIKRLQRALRAEGFQPGLIDGVLGQQTLSAVNSYQRKKNLPRGGLTMSTIESLGIQL